MKNNPMKNTKKINHNYSGTSLNELYAKYGKNSSGFYSNWWANEKFANEHPDKGVYEIDFAKRLENLTYEEQKAKLKEGEKFPHTAVLAEVILEYKKKTGENLLPSWYSRTSSVDSDGD